MSRVLIGKLRMLPHDEWYIDLENGDAVMIDMAAPPPPINRRIALSVDESSTGVLFTVGDPCYALLEETVE